MRTLICVAAVATAIGTACGSSGGGDGEPGPGPGPGPTETPDGSPTPTPTPTDGATPTPSITPGDVPNGGVCTAPGDCMSTICANLFAIGTGYCSVECQSNDDCAFDDGNSYQCLDVQGGQVCIRSCEGDGVCPANNLCLDDVNIGSDDFPVLKDLCIDLTNDLCGIDGDCAERTDGRTMCGPISNGSVLRNVCLEPTGDIALGQACDASLDRNRDCTRRADCPAGWMCDEGTCEPPDAQDCAFFDVCLQPGVCSGSCRTDADCPTDMACSAARELLDDKDDDDASNDVYGEVKLCTMLKAGSSRGACVREADCTAAEEACQLHTDDQGRSATICGGTFEGSVGVGEDCTDEDDTADVNESKMCQSAFCLAAGYCAGWCTAAADCGEGDWQCLQVDLGDPEVPVVVGMCLEGATCSKPADCGEERSCGIVGHEGGITQVCERDVGDLVLGATCDPQKDDDDEDVTEADLCASGLCLIRGACSEYCSEDADCPGADWACRGLELVYDDLDDGDDANDLTSVHRICLLVPGSRAACQRDADCQNGELCTVLNDADANPTTICLAPMPDGAAGGEDCGDTDDDTDTPDVECANGMCEPRNDQEDDDGRGTCRPLCLTDEQCPQGYVCGTVPVNPTDTKTVAACVPAPADNGGGGGGQ